jgi:hypothetical protein
MDTTPQVAPAAPAASAPAQEQVAPQTTDTPTPDSAPQQDTAQQEERRRKSAAERIDQLTARYRDEQRAREAAESRLASYERQQQVAKQFSELDAQAPDIRRFDNLAEYQMAMADWTTRRATAHAMTQWEERQQHMATQHAQEAAKVFEHQQRVMHENVVLEEKMAAGTKKYPDFMQALTNPELPSTRGTPLFDAVMATDNAADIAYSLAKNPAELDRLLAIRNPMQLSREVFRLDQKFTGTGATQAPPPPPQRNGASASSRSWGEMSTAEHVKAYREAKAKRR